MCVFKAVVCATQFVWYMCLSQMCCVVVCILSCLICCSHTCISLQRLLKCYLGMLWVANHCVCPWKSLIFNNVDRRSTWVRWSHLTEKQPRKRGVEVVTSKTLQNDFVLAGWRYKQRRRKSKIHQGLVFLFSGFLSAWDFWSYLNRRGARLFLACCSNT